MTTIFENEVDNIQLTSNVGRKFIFLVPGRPNDEMFRHSSKLEDIGVNWDCTLKNNTEVIVVSDAVGLDIPKYGKIEVIKVMAAQAQWVRSENLFPSEEKYQQ